MCSTAPVVWPQVDYTGFSTINAQRFGQKFVGKVANPHDILLWHKAPVRKAKVQPPVTPPPPFITAYNLQSCHPCSTGFLCRLLVPWHSAGIPELHGTVLGYVLRILLQHVQHLNMSTALGVCSCTIHNWLDCPLVHLTQRQDHGFWENEAPAILVCLVVSSSCLFSLQVMCIGAVFAAQSWSVILMMSHIYSLAVSVPCLVMFGEPQCQCCDICRPQ